MRAVPVADRGHCPVPLGSFAGRFPTSVSLGGGASANSPGGANEGTPQDTGPVIVIGRDGAVKGGGTVSLPPPTVGAENNPCGAVLEVEETGGAAAETAEEEADCADPGTRSPKEREREPGRRRSGTRFAT